MLQDFGGVFRNEYIHREIAESDHVMCFQEDKLLIREEGEPCFPTVGQWRTWTGVSGEAQRGDGERWKDRLQYLFSIDGTSYYLDLPKEWNLTKESKLPEEFKLPEECELPEEREMSGERNLLEEWNYVPVRSLRNRNVPEDCFAAATAYHLYVWYRDNRFCGRCAHRLTADGMERMLRCPVCGNMVYPKIAPAVIIGLVDADRILVSRYANRSYRKYALLAGFTEIGETAEDTVRREVMEEVGLKVRDIVYYKSQPWGFDSNLLMGFFARLEGGDTIRLDREELAVAEWVSRKDDRIWELLQDDGVSLTREMMGFFHRNGEDGIW